MTRGHRAKKIGIEKIVVGKTKRERFLKYNSPKKREFGKDTKKCPRCNTNWGFISKYGLNICRRCFRQIAPQIGFKKNR